MRAPDWPDIVEAGERLRGVTVRTPLLRSDAIDDFIGAPVWFKAECLQRTGSFKMRGAYNRVSRISAAERACGVVAFSSGNHAQAVAEAARLVGVKATIVMPSDAPRIKIEGVRRRGGTVRLYDRINESREAIAAELVEATGAALAPPYDHPETIAGQATAAVEAIEDARALGVEFASAIVCTSGGGLVAGAALAFETLSAGTDVYSAEPAGHDDTRRSLYTLVRESNPPGVRSICDALLTPEPGELTFEINCGRLRGGLSAKDETVLDAMAAAFHHLKVVVEPGGAAAFAALMEAKKRFAGGGPVLVYLSGGNVDPDVYRRAIERPDPMAG